MLYLPESRLGYAKPPNANLNLNNPVAKGILSYAINNRLDGNYGIRQGAYSFNGTTQDATVTESNYLQEFTVLVRFKAAGAINTQLSSVFNKATNIQFNWGHPGAAFQQAFAYQDIYSSWKGLKVPYTMHPGEWHTIAVTMSADGMRGWTDRVGYFGKGGYIRPISISHVMCLGKQSGGNNRWEGLIDFFILWDRPLPNPITSDLVSNPSQLFEDNSVGDFWIPNAVSPSSSTVPVYSHHYTQMRSY